MSYRDLVRVPLSLSLKSRIAVSRRQSGVPAPVSPMADATEEAIFAHMRSMLGRHAEAGTQTVNCPPASYPYLPQLIRSWESCADSDAQPLPSHSCISALPPDFRASRMSDHR